MYLVEYRYSIEEDGCGCCQYTVSEMMVTLGGRVVVEVEVPLCEDDEDLRKAMRDYCPEFEEYEIGSTQYF